MKRLLLLLALATSSMPAATLLVSDFGDTELFTPPLLQPQPVNPADGPWTELTAQSGTTSYTIGDFGQGTPSGLIGNGFLQFLAAPVDWSSFGFISLTGSLAATNATPFLYFYVEDSSANSSSLTAIDLAGFSGSTTVSTALLFGGVDLTQVSAWGFLVNEASPLDFGFTFDNLSLSTTEPPASVPDVASSALLLGFALAGLVGFRRVAVLA